MRLTRLIVVVAFFLGSPGGLHGQELSFLSGLDGATRAAVQPTLAAAARDSLPVRALQSKVLEGVAKGAEVAQIGQVVSTLADDFRRARSALRAELPGVPLEEGEIVATATAARQGISYDVVSTLWQARQEERSLEIPVTVLSELVRRDVPVAEAAALLAHVVRTAVPLPVAAQIPGKFDGALSAGAPPSGALAEALRVLDIPRPPRPSGRGRPR